MNLIIFIMAFEFHLRAVCSCGQSTGPRLWRQRFIPFSVSAFIALNGVKDIFLSLPINFSHYYFEKMNFATFNKWLFALCFPREKKRQQQLQ